MNNSYNQQTTYMLNRYIHTKAEIENIRLEIEEIENNYNVYNSIIYSDKVCSSEHIQSIVEKELTTREYRLPKLKNLLRSKEIEICRINSAITTLTDREKSILEYRYFKKMKWNDIGQITNLTDVRCRQINSLIIKKLSELLFIEL